MQCKATSKRSGVRCKKAAMRGATVCLAHGGGAGHVRVSAARNVLEQDARRVWAAMDHPPVTDPLAELQALAGQLVAWRDLLKDRIGELTTIGYAGMTSEQIRAEIMLYRDSVNQLTTLLTNIARLNIDERLTAIEERKRDLLADAVEAAIAEVRLDRGEAARARSAVVRHLRLVRGGEAA